MNRLEWQQRDLIVMFNISQGHTYKQYFKSELVKHVRKAKTLVVVISDFTDFCDNNNLFEYLGAFYDFLQEAKLKPNRVMINHDDIDLSRIIEKLLIDKSQLKNERDEIEFIAEIQKRGLYMKDKDNFINMIGSNLPRWRSN